VAIELVEDGEDRWRIPRSGGMLVDVLSWRWAFLINVPFALVILGLTPFAIPVGRSLESVRLDIPGATSVTLGLLALVFGIIEWFVPALIAGLVLLALFVWIERHATPRATKTNRLTCAPACSSSLPRRTTA